MNFYATPIHPLHLDLYRYPSIAPISLRWRTHHLPLCEPLSLCLHSHFIKLLLVSQSCHLFPLLSMPLFMVASGLPHASEYWLKLPLLVSLSLVWAKAVPDPLLLQGILQYQQVGLVYLLWGHCLIPWVMVCTGCWVWPSFMEFLFPAQPCRVPGFKSCWSSKLHSLGAPPLVTRPPGWEALHCAQDFHTAAELLCY